MTAVEDSLMVSNSAMYIMPSFLKGSTLKDNSLHLLEQILHLRGDPF